MPGRILILFLLINSAYLTTFGQAGYKLFIKTDPVYNGKYRYLHSDSASVVMELNNYFRQLHKQHYFSATLDSVFLAGDSVNIMISLGERYDWAQLKKGEMNDELLEKSALGAKFFSKRRYRAGKFYEFEKKLLDYCENHGHPFALVQLDSVNIVGNSVNGNLNFYKGPEILFDSLNIEGNTKVKSRYLKRHLRIFEGQPYSQKRINEIEARIRELGFLRQYRDPVVVFKNGKAYVNLFLEEKKLNQVDGIVGFLPNQAKNNKLLLTGELNLNLKNLFGTGKNIGLEWRKYGEASQILNVSYFHPKLLGSSLDTKINFNFLKQDSSFLNVFRGIVFSQPLNGQGKVHFSAGLKTSRKLSSSLYADSKRLVLSDFDHYTYGLAYTYNTLDDIYYPKKGFYFELGGQVGNKIIQKDYSLNDSLYRNINLRSIQYSANFTFSQFIKVGKRAVLMGKVDAGKLFNQNNNLLINDLYRIGGLKSLRGFNENYFFATSFASGTLEYRFFTDETSFLFLFYDQGYIENQISSTNKSDTPSGIGAGVSFATPAGLFSFVYSLGSSKDQKMSLNLSKIHFGIVSRF